MEDFPQKSPLSLAKLEKSPSLTNNKSHDDNLIPSHFQAVENDRDKTFYCLLALSISVPILTIALLLSVWLNFRLKSEIYLVKPDNSIARATPNYTDAHRDRDRIAHLAESWLKLTYEWDLNHPDPQSQPCIASLKTFNVVMPCKTHDAGFLLSPKIRDPILAAISKSIPTKVYEPQGIFSAVKVYFTGSPRNLGNGIYEIDLIASRRDFIETIKPSGLVVRTEVGSQNLNSTFTFKTIPPDLLVLGEDENITYRQKINQLLSSGLIITRLKEYKNVPDDFKKFEVKIRKQQD
ncbi:MAG: hypothetical protein QNJ38_14490 [Prochloraceae cyanobacterium]|nr:hypothetical protein [Prochloraceae cyanobacterium]